MERLFGGLKPLRERKTLFYRRGKRSRRWVVRAVGKLPEKKKERVLLLLSLARMKWEFNLHPNDRSQVLMVNEPSTTSFSNAHVDVPSSKPFEQVIKDLQAELGKASTEHLMGRLSSSNSFDEFTEEMESLAGRSNLIEVAFLNWGKVLTLAAVPMKAQLFVVGNPLTARKLLEAGGPEVGLYLPTKIYVYEDASGVAHVSYDKFGPVMEQYQNENLSKIAGVIDGVLADLAAAAA